MKNLFNHLCNGRKQLTIFTESGKDCSKKRRKKKERKEGSRVIYHRTDEFIIEPRQAALVFSGQTIPCGIVGRLIVHFHLSVRADGLTKKGGSPSPIPKKEKAARRRADRKRNSRNPRRITTPEAHTTAAANKNPLEWTNAEKQESERERKRKRDSS